MFLAKGIVTYNVLRPSHDDTNKVWKMGWSQSKMAVGNQVPILIPSSSDFERCLPRGFVGTWKSNVHWMVL